jgi:hypothetical protein
MHSEHRARYLAVPFTTPAVANVDVDSEGFASIPEDDFVRHFAADIDAVKAKVMYAVQQPLHTSTFDDVLGAPRGGHCPRDIWATRATR